MLRWLAGIALIFGIGVAVLTGRLTMIFPALMLGTMPYVLEAIIGTVDPESERSPNPFYAAIATKNFASLEQILGSRTDLDDGAKAYVLAQASVVAGETSKWIPRAAKSLQDSSYSERLEVPAAVAYAIEATVHGPDSPSLSTKADGYRQEALADAQKWKHNSYWALLLAGLFGFLFIGTESIAQIISRRIKRIGELLTPLR